MADHEQAAVFAEVTGALERADLSDAALLGADADPVKLALRIRASMPAMAAQLGEAGHGSIRWCWMSAATAWCGLSASRHTEGPLTTYGRCSYCRGA